MNSPLFDIKANFMSKRGHYTGKKRESQNQIKEAIESVGSGATFPFNIICLFPESSMSPEKSSGQLRNS